MTPSTADPGRRFTPIDDPAVGVPPLAADVDARPIRAPRSSSWLLAALIALVAIAALAYYLWQQNQARETAQTPPISAPATPQAAATPPAVDHPIEDARGNAPPSIEQKPLPALMVSDTTMQNALTELFGAGALC
jgi:cytochrome c-type biogenesis protein CcmH/NrfG